MQQFSPSLPTPPSRSHAPLQTEAMPSVTSLKRVDRNASSDQLLSLDGLAPAAKQRGVPLVEQAATPLLPPMLGESKSAYFARLGRRLRTDMFSAASTFDRDGLYIYKRPVRSGAGDKAALLASGGSVFNHVAVYLKQGGQLTALEFGPANAMDITDNMLIETTAAPVLLPHPAPHPEPQHLPMLHIAAPHHPLEAEHVQKAIAFAEGTAYHALRNNCICFADFLVRVLTGGLVKGAPLIFDHLVGKVPAADSPLLALLALMAQLSWHDVCDGSRLTRAFLQQHPASLLPPPPHAQAPAPSSILLPEPAVQAPEAATEAAAPALCTAAGAGAGAGAAAVPTPPGLPPQLAAFLTASGWLPAGGAAAGPAGPAGPARAELSSSSSEDTCGAMVGPAEPAEPAEPAVAGAASSAPGGSAASASLASTGSSKRVAGVPGLHLPARKGPAKPPRTKQ